MILPIAPNEIVKINERKACRFDIKAAMRIISAGVFPRTHVDIFVRHCGGASIGTEVEKSCIECWLKRLYLERIDKNTAQAGTRRDGAKVKAVPKHNANIVTKASRAVLRLYLRGA